MRRPRNSVSRACPDSETIAALVDGTLRGDARARATEHLAACESCYFVYTEITQRTSDSFLSPVKLSQSKRRMSAAAVIAVAASLVLLLPRLTSTVL